MVVYRLTLGWQGHWHPELEQHLRSLQDTLAPEILAVSGPNLAKRALADRNWATRKITAGERSSPDLFLPSAVQILETGRWQSKKVAVVSIIKSKRRAFAPCCPSRPTVAPVTPVSHPVLASVQMSFAVRTLSTPSRPVAHLSPLLAAFSPP